MVTDDDDHVDNVDVMNKITITLVSTTIKQKQYKTKITICFKEINEMHHDSPTV